MNEEKRKEENAMELNPVLITKDLIKIDSTDPGTYEDSIFTYIKDYLQNLPASLVEFTEAEVLPKRHNLMACLPCKNPTQPDLILICHMDTVPIGNDWTMSPFEATEKDEYIYGRGACDMKSGLACALTAFAHAVEQASTGHLLTRTLRFIATVDEEDEMRGVEHAIAAGWIPENAHILDTEPCNRRILTGHKGRVWFHLNIQGKAAHASNPWMGADAIAGMSEVISYLRKHSTELPKDDYFGPSSLCFGQISGGTTKYAVSDSCQVTMDFRLVPPATSTDAALLLEQAIAYASKQVPGIIGNYQCTGDRPAIPYYKDSELLANLKEAYEKILGASPQIQVFTGYTDSAVISARTGNQNCVSFGPGNLEVAHKPDEWVAVQDILDCRKILDELIFS